MYGQTAFLSCRGEDAPLSERVRRALAGARWTIVDDKEAISSAGLFVACVSTGGYVAEELEIAIETLQRLERDRAWLMVVRLDACDVPALPITVKVTLQDLVVDLDDIPIRLAQRQSRRSVISETDAERIMASRGVIVGTQVSDEAGGELQSKTTYREVVIDHDITFIGTVFGKRTGNES